MNAPRIALLGARRRRQGLGPYVARYLREAGAVVPCFLGTSDATVALARDELRSVAGVEATGYLDAHTMLAEHEVDALAVLTPPATHLEGLELALEHRLHVLCEKPLSWKGAGDAEAAERVTRAFADADLLLVENAQWPFTLPSFHALHPESVGVTPHRFEMLMAPASHGEGMLVDSMSHPLSLLQTLLPDDRATLRDIRFDGLELGGREAGSAARGSETAGSGGGSAPDLRVDFVYATADRKIDVTVRFVHTTDQPRRAGYALDGRWAHRFIRVSDYALFFGAGARVVDVPDPLQVLISDFVDRLRRRIIAPPVPLTMLSCRMRMLHELVGAFRTSDS